MLLVILSQYTESFWIMENLAITGISVTSIFASVTLISYLLLVFSLILLLFTVELFYVRLDSKDLLRYFLTNWFQKS